ncbi:MAG: hypothetical protein ACKVJ6_07775 [Flavobacteriales bacterium]|tara:strand:+ start:385 stop:681 length:297 start_codon:yes stop_codon:yes gene_type:complete
METTKIKTLNRKTSLKLQWNMSIADYNNNRISEEELENKFDELFNRWCEYVLENENHTDENGNRCIPIDGYFDWRLPKDVIDLKQYKQSFDNTLKMVA